MSLRLNKLLARRGLGARRKCDALIQQGRVRVNGRLVREPGTLVEPDRDRVEVAGRPLPPQAAARYFALHKPVGVITTLHDPEGRRTIRELLPPGPRLFPVGRLDADTSGLLLLTNDGELAYRLMHPRYGVEKVYRAWLDRAPTPGQLARLRQGVEFEPGFVSEPARVRPLPSDRDDGRIEIAIHEGRYRQVRRMCEAVGLQVTRLHRSAYGPLRLGPIERGMWRELSQAEVARLRAASARPRPRGRAPRAAEYFSARRGLVRRRPEGRHEPAARRRERPIRAERPEGRREPAARRRERPFRAERPEGRREPAARRRERPFRAERPEGRHEPAARRRERPIRAERPERPGSGRREGWTRGERSERPARRRDGWPQRERSERPGARRRDGWPRSERSERPGRPPARRAARPSERGPRGPGRLGNSPRGRVTRRSRGGRERPSGPSRPPRRR